jgi:hypothetical protein
VDLPCEKHNRCQLRLIVGMRRAEQLY